MTRELLFSVDSRRWTFPVILIALITTVSVPATVSGSPRPNILLIVADDQGREAGCYGTAGIATPSVDHLADQGMLFRLAFSAYPSCSPSRATMLTGVYPHTHRITINVPEHFGASPPAAALEGPIKSYTSRGLFVPESLPTLPELLKQAGYRTAITHKLHVLPHTKFPFDKWLPGRPEELKKFFAGEPDRPFFMMHNLAPPHRPFALHLKRLEAKPVDAAKVKVPACLPDIPVVRQDWADYLSSIQAADEDLGRALEALRQSGQFDNTIIIYTGDNGPAFQRGKASTYPLGLREPLIVTGPGVLKGQQTAALASYVDLMPTILDYADVPVPASVQGHSLRPLLEGRPGAAGHDLVVGEIHGAPKPNNYQERGATDGRWHYIRRRNVASGREINADDFDEKPWGNRTYAATLAARDQFPLPYRLLMTWKTNPPPEELYDVQSDPDCTHDLSQDSVHAGDLRRMRGALDQWIRQTDDQAMAASKPNIIVILTDDQGYADLSAQGQVRDIKTPHIDSLAKNGVRCTAGYITAPQCSPSRAGLITGRYQQRFGLDTIPDCPLPLEEVTIAERLHAAGYVSGMVGKWHLDPNPTCRRWLQEHLPEAAQRTPGRVPIPEKWLRAYSPLAQGFDECFMGEMHRYLATFDLQGQPVSPQGEWVREDGYRLDIQTEAALAFLQRNRAKPFFLYLGYFGPHVPLEATKQYLDRFPGQMPERRRYALSMLSAIDDGVGRVLQRLRDYGLEDNTLIVFTSDNGAPLMKTKPDTRPITENGWDGSLNDPWVGEKGMLAEGGIRVPFLLQWKGVLPAGRVYDQPVSSLDIAATAVALAGLPSDKRLDGVNLIPFLTDKISGSPHEALYWRFWNQAAIRSGKWKYLRTSTVGEYLFDLQGDADEKKNLIKDHPEMARQLGGRLATWTGGLNPPGVPSKSLNNQEEAWYEFYFKQVTAVAH
jgi:arylsulfatase A-like enzyme